MTETISHGSALSKAAQDVLHSSEWQYVVDPSGSALQFIRVDPPNRCLCPTCCMNYPAKMDLSDRLQTWRMQYAGDFKSDKATMANTFLIVVSVLSSDAASSPSKAKTRKEKSVSRDFFLTVDGSMRLDLLNHIVASAYAPCDCHAANKRPAPFLFLGDTCLTPWGGVVEAKDTLEHVYENSSEFTSLGYILSRMNRIRPRVDRDWTFLQTVQRVVKIDAVFPPCSDHSVSCTTPKEMPSEFKVKYQPMGGSPRCADPTVKRIVDWFYSIAAVHLADNQNCLVCSLHSTPMAYHWFCACRDKCSNKSPCLITHSLPTQLMGHVNCWRDAASVAYEIFMMVHLGEHMASQISFDNVDSPKNSTKKSSIKRKRNGKAQAQEYQQQSCDLCDPLQLDSHQINSDDEISQFERRLMSFDHDNGCDCGHKITLPNAVFDGLRHAMIKLMEGRRHPNDQPPS